jgi:hypothetical protein
MSLCHRSSPLTRWQNDALRQLKKIQPRLLAIDEIHHLLACTPREQRAALNILKYLSNQLRVSIVALGISEALHVMRTDPQIASRFESCALPSWVQHAGKFFAAHIGSDRNVSH